MLKEFIATQQALPKINTLSFQEYVTFTVKAFDAGVDFLKDSAKFRNREINDLVTLLWRSVGNKITPTVLDQWGVPTLSFLAMESRKTGEMMPLVIIPINYLDQARQDPVNQLGGISFMASQCRDFTKGLLNSQNSPDVDRRSRGYEAETLLTIQDMAKKEDIPLVFSAYQEYILKENPLGLKSLPRGMAYSTIPFNTRDN